MPYLHNNKNEKMIFTRNELSIIKIKKKNIGIINILVDILIITEQIKN